MTTKQISLWSWLIRWDIRSKIFCPPGLNVTLDQFAAQLSKQIEENELPARVEQYEVSWDIVEATQPRIAVEYTGDDSSTNIIQFLIGIDKMGRFTYVEEKVCFKPPTLPKIPGKKKRMEDGLNILGSPFFWFVVVLGTCAYVVPGIVIILIGGLMDGMGGSNVDEINNWNWQVEQEQKAWDEAINSWLGKIRQTNYLSQTDDIPGRFTEAVSDTVKQVIKTLFEDQQAKLEEREKNERTQQEIEAELEKRRQEGFK
ncbi:hypothetical protein QUF58_08790 [Anaerolineales bacterium HSG24]|nr:hypothetical protein [Anaerolineales bacterium HSG24]